MRLDGSYIMADLRPLVSRARERGVNSSKSHTIQKINSTVRLVDFGINAAGLPHQARRR